MVTYPVQTLAPARVIAVSSTSDKDPITLASSTEYSLLFSFSAQASTFPSLVSASMVNSAGNVVVPNSESILSLLEDYANTSNFVLVLGMLKCPCSHGLTSALLKIVLSGQGNNSWPMGSFNAAIINKDHSQCENTAALLDWIYFTQTSDEAASICTNNGVSQAGASSTLLKQIINQLAAVECDGVAVSAIASCVMNTSGEVCSNHGSCLSGVCNCTAGWKGAYCQNDISSSPSNPSPSAAPPSASASPSAPAPAASSSPSSHSPSGSPVSSISPSQSPSTSVSPSSLPVASPILQNVSIGFNNTAPAVNITTGGLEPLILLDHPYN